MALQTPRTADGRPIRSVTGGSALASARLGDLGRALFRYRGLALLAVGILVASAVMPGPAARSGDEEGDQTSGFVAATPVQERPVTPPVLSDAPTVVDDQPRRAATIDQSSRFVSPARERGVSTPSRPAPERSPTAAGPAAPIPTTTSTTAISPLRIRASGWSTRTAGTPLASEGVPTNALPVGRRLGADDKLSFVRLTGTATVLSLQIGPEDGQRSPEEAGVVACPVTSDWQPAEAMSFSNDPTYDCSSPAAGQRQPDGSWTFDLSAFPDRTGDKGFALVPSGDDPLADWQVAFAARG